MSRIGRMPIPIPKGVDISVKDNNITVKGPKGTLTRDIAKDLSIEIDGETLLVKRPSDDKMHKSLHGLTRTLISNMVTGVTTGFAKTLEIQGVGYRAALQGAKLNIQVGYSHPVEVEPKDGINFEVGQNPDNRAPLIIVHGIDKEVVGQQAAEIRAIRKPEPYKGKGIRYQGEYVRRKAGKSAKAAGAGKK